MKISVLADSDGTILGFAHEAGTRRPNGNHETGFATEEGQSLHSVELPPELLAHFGKDSFAGELFRHSVVKRGKSASLRRAKR